MRTNAPRADCPARILAARGREPVPLLEPEVQPPAQRRLLLLMRPVEHLLDLREILLPLPEVPHDLFAFRSPMCKLFTRLRGHIRRL